MSETQNQDPGSSFAGIVGEQQQPNLGQTIVTTPSDNSLVSPQADPAVNVLTQPIPLDDPTAIAMGNEPLIQQPVQGGVDLSQPPPQATAPIANPLATDPNLQMQPNIATQEGQFVPGPTQPQLPGVAGPAGIANPLEQNVPVQNFQQPGPGVQPGQVGQPQAQPFQQVQQQPVQPVQQVPQQQVPIQPQQAQQIQQPQAIPVQQPGVIQQNTVGQPVAQTVQNTTPAMNIDPTAAFAPPMQPGQSLICKISPGKFDAFVKILSILNEKNVIIINNSNICQSINNGSAIVTANLSNLIDSANNAISLHILNPKKYLKYFKNIKGEADIHFIDDQNNQRYIVTNGDMSIYLPKQIEALEQDATPPDLTSAIPIGQTIEIDKEVRSIITTMASDSANIDLLMQGNQLKAIYIPETAVYSFKDYIKDQIDDTNADLKLRSYSFLQVPGDSYKVSIGQIGDGLWSLTFVNTGLVTISVMESLSPVSDDNLII